MPPSSEASATAGGRQRRARSLDPHLARLARELFAVTEELLTVGVRAAFEPCATTFVEEPAQVASLGREFDGALWLLGQQPAKRPAARASATSERAVPGASDLGSGSPQAGLAMLRPQLRPAAPVLLVASARPPALAQLRALLLTPLVRASARFDSRERAAWRPTIESLCEAVLLAGLCTPRVHTDHPGWLAVSACLPSTRSALDHFFEQPASTPRR